jgi:TolB-like protein/DNA-binding winged helix-turn-helix (wHTH) protein/Flp pilus assembly protein TadD
LKRLLLRDGQCVPLTSKVFETLLALVSRGGEVLEKNELMRLLWPDTIVEENNLTQNVSVLRKALGDARHEHRYIVTIPGRGYSFVATVKETYADEEVSPEGKSAARPFMEAARMGDDGESPDGKSRDGARVTSFGRNGHTAAMVSGTQPNTWRTLHTWRTLLDAGWWRAVTPSSRQRVMALSVLLLFAVTALSYLWIISKSRPPLKASAPGSIAVLPFKLLGDEARDEYLGSGMADALITKLSNIRQISVRPTSAVIRYVGGKSTDPLAAGRELGVDSVLEGTIQRADERVRVTVQLISVRESKTLWAHSFDERFTDIFTVQDSISAQVAQALTLKLTGEEQRLLAKRYTDNVEAYQSYLRGRYFMNRRNEEGLLKAIAYFTEAIELEPGYALAYAGLADAYSVLGFYQFGARAPEEVFQKAKAAATRAIELDETLAEAHASLALARLDVDQDEAGAEREYRRSIELNPNYAPAHHWYSDFLAMMDRQDEAMAEIKLALELDPLSLVINATLGERLFYARRYDDAAAQLRKTLEMEEGFGPAHYLLGLTYEQKGMYEQALAELGRARELSGGSPWMVAAFGHTLAMAGRRHEAQKVLVELKELSRRRPVSPYDMATVYTGLDEKTQAFEWLQKSYKPQVRRLLKADPRMDRLRLDPRFQEIYSS